MGAMQINHPTLLLHSAAHKLPHRDLFDVREWRMGVQSFWRHGHRNMLWRSNGMPFRILLRLCEQRMGMLARLGLWLHRTAAHGLRPWHLLDVRRHLMGLQGQHISSRLMFGHPDGMPNRLLLCVRERRLGMHANLSRPAADILSARNIFGVRGHFLEVRADGHAKRDLHRISGHMRPRHQPFM